MARGFRSEEDAVSIDGVECVGQSASAILVRIPDHDEELWIPQSQVTDDSEVYRKGHVGTLVITAWIADKKGLA